MHLLKAYVTVHKFDLICLSETYLDSSIPFDDNNLEISGYNNLTRSDHLSNSKRGCVCIYYKKFLPLRVCDISLLDECINFELKVGYKLFTFVAFYRSLIETQDDFLSFSQNFELTFEKLSENNPYLLVAIGDFNAKLSHWYSLDTNTFEGVSVENVVSQLGLHQIVKEPTHILENSSSCIDLIFTSEPNLIANSGSHPSLHPNRHHQIIYAKFNLKIHYPPPYTHEVWHYKDSNDDLIRRAMNQFNWERTFENKNVDEKGLTFNKAILNIVSDFIIHESHEKKSQNVQSSPTKTLRIITKLTKESLCKIV